MSDNELDNLFKEAAEGFRAPNDPSAWQDMARKLDGAAVVTSFWNWKTISSTALVGVTALALIVYLSISDSSSVSDSTSELITASDPGKAQGVKNGAVDSKSADNNQKDGQASQVVTEAKSDATAPRDSKSEKSLIANSAKSNPSDNQAVNAVKKNTSESQGREVQQNTRTANVSDKQSAKAIDHQSATATDQSSKTNENQSAKALDNQNGNVTAPNSSDAKNHTNKNGNNSAAAAAGALVVTEKVVPATQSNSKISEGNSGEASDSNGAKSQQSLSKEKVAPTGEQNAAPIGDRKTAVVGALAVSEKSRESRNSSNAVLDDGKTKEVSSASTDTKTQASGTDESSKKKNAVGMETAGAIVVAEKSHEANNGRNVTAGDVSSKQATANGAGVKSEAEVAVPDSVKKAEELKDEPKAKEVSEKDEPETKEEKISFNRLALKLTVAPDYSTVKSATPNGLGINYGMLIEYRITKHWSVATGGIWSKKIYSANDVEYGGYHADWVDGDCRMWDIPINVYYNFKSEKPFSFYASAGLSSYIMNEENYVYYVETPYGTYDYPKQVKGENNEWFKTLNVSVGMQFRMSQQFSLQFEPTLKAPLAGVGEGEVSLVSLGAFFNLRYEIQFNKRRRNED